MLREGELVIIDGEAGHVLATPHVIALAFYRDKRQQQQQYRAGLVRLKGRAAISRDGMRLKLLANLELSEDAKIAGQNGAEGDGLYRTEFLHLNTKTSRKSGL